MDRPLRFSWKAAINAGLLAGLVFIVLAMIMVPIFAGASPWGPLRMIGAIALGTGALPPPATFDLGIITTALIVHFALSAVYALILNSLIRRFSMAPAILIGAAFGLGLYFINYYGFTALFPWFAEGRNWITVFVHLVFGALAAALMEKWEIREESLPRG